jgi:hypothetical protein
VSPEKKTYVVFAFLFKFNRDRWMNPTARVMLLIATVRSV